MITILNKEMCVGCTGCFQVCPKQCISMIEDSQGFKYPHVDLSSCVDCHLCEKICPVINQNSTQEPINVFAAVNNNAEIQNTPSLLAKAE